MGRNATPENFRDGLEDQEGVSIFVGHAYTDTEGLVFGGGRDDRLQGITNNNPIVCVAACASSRFAAKFGINSETKGKAFVGFRGNVNSLFLARISSQLTAYLNKGMTIGEAVNKLRTEYRNNKTFSVVLIGDASVTLEEHE